LGGGQIVRSGHGPQTPSLEPQQHASRARRIAPVPYRYIITRNAAAFWSSHASTLFRTRLECSWRMTSVFGGCGPHYRPLKRIIFKQSQRHSASSIFSLKSYRRTGAWETRWGSHLSRTVSLVAGMEPASWSCVSSCFEVVTEDCPLHWIVPSNSPTQKSSRT
jgi:hypothetical protein